MVLNETDKVMILKNLKRINELVTGFNSSFISTVVSGGYHRSQPLHIRTVVPLCEGIDFLNVHAYMDFLIKEGSKNLIFIINRGGKVYNIHLEDDKQTKELLTESNGWSTAVMLFLNWKQVKDDILNGIQKEEKIFDAIHHFSL